ncbi:type VI secretion system-associated protein TagF [Novosphingobium sp.]|uniref:type VI secretion system-associated protein TagF n=1 Tax=Novosphingobium sp. TaxID=1874826 RepID=UPI002733D1EC|nr:type VI secretion system-associated protein TagF [Novosphingobium sp.]MDP3908203.1 type VI secretion system-associated protein TagF [Novosphingobium sp.]
MTALLFGKLPAHGDFVARGLTEAQQHYWDTRLSSAMQVAQGAYGDEFADRFSAAPPWRCVVADGGDNWLAGALAPSIDRAGRIFPILLARRTANRVEAAGYAAACEELLFAALPGQWSADELLRQASAVTPAGADECGPDGWWLDGAELLPDPPAPLSAPFPPNLISSMIAVTEQLA